MIATKLIGWVVEVVIAVVVIRWILDHWRMILPLLIGWAGGLLHWVVHLHLL
jgi:hypothetical protein